MFVYSSNHFSEKNKNKNKKSQLWPFIKTDQPGHRSPDLQILTDDPPHFHSPKPLRHRPPGSQAGIFAIYRLKSRLI